MSTDTDNKRLITILQRLGISNHEVLTAMQQVERRLFVSPDAQQHAYENIALPIAQGQTISQPYIVARMSQALMSLGPKVTKVLEIGTGSGYQAAVLSYLAQQVYTVERIYLLYKTATELLSRLYSNIHCHYDDGYRGWPEQAPFDGILITAATTEVPKPLYQQLAHNGGRLIVPLGTSAHQVLYCIERNGEIFSQQPLEEVRFVPLKPGLQ
jgi:protein-L-isoaspartate(D-aspartate) O-methyltransferase